MMVELRGDKLLVGFHEWAWSARTSGFPVLAVVGEKVVKIGETTKRPITYKIPSGAEAIVKVYQSNKGYLRLTIYLVNNDKLETHVVSEQNNFKADNEQVQRIANIVLNHLNRR